MTKVKMRRDAYLYRGDHKKGEVVEIPDDLATAILSWPEAVRLADKIGEGAAAPSPASFADKLEDQERKLENKTHVKKTGKTKKK